MASKEAQDTKANFYRNSLQSCYIIGTQSIKSIGTVKVKYRMSIGITSIQHWYKYRYNIDNIYNIEIMIRLLVEEQEPQQLISVILKSSQWRRGSGRMDLSR